MKDKPTYIDRINAFWNWRMFNPITDKAMALYFALLHCANRAGFPEEICIPNSTLLSMIGMEIRDLYRTRNLLEQIGLVEIEKGKRGQSATYRLTPISDRISDNISDRISDNISDTYGNIYRQDKDKEKDYKPPKPPKGVTEAKRPALFNEFWTAYPRKVGKGDAIKAWNKLDLTDELVSRIMEAVRVQRTWEQWQRDGGRYIPHPSTWLNQQRWEDEGTVFPEDQKRKEEYSAWLRGEID